jgi:predicted RNA binding protein YcfA (HicA-like mRNA interferase family)
MPPLPVLRAKEVLRALLSAGFYIHHQTGSHARLFHHTKIELRVTVPIHNKELPPKTLKSIIRQAGLTVEEFLELL